MSELYIAWSPLYAHPLPLGHRFPMLKYELIPEQLMHEGTISATHLHEPRLCDRESILITHAEAYLYKLEHQTLSPKEEREIGFKQSRELTLREKQITQGTLDCCFAAMQDGVALNIAGGTHHAYADHGEGFCLLNDFAVAANLLLHKGLIRRALIVDLDVHQGNGTAKIFENEPRVYTFSMHGAHNYPFRKEKSDLDIALADGTGDEAYLQMLSAHLPALIAQQRPDMVFYLAGVDILATDRFGKLAVSMEACKTRDRFVFSLLQNNNIPCVVAMGGGYSADVKIITEAHCNTFRVAKDLYNLD